jgi:hypothetical protein
MGTHERPSLVLRRLNTMQPKTLWRSFGWPSISGFCRMVHRNQSINRKGAYILADIHGMDHFCPKLAPQPFNKLEGNFTKRILTKRIGTYEAYTHKTNTHKMYRYTHKTYTHQCILHTKRIPGAIQKRIQIFSDFSLCFFLFFVFTTGARYLIL